MKLISCSIDFGCASMAPSWPCEKGSRSLAPPSIRPLVLTQVNTWFHLFSLIYVTVLLRGQVVLNLLPLGTNNHLLRSQATGCRNEFSFSSFFFWKLEKKLTLAAIQFCGLTELIWKLSYDALIIISSIVKMLNTDCFEGQCFRILIILYSFGLLHIHMYMLSHNDKVRKVHLQKFNPFL